MSLYDYLVNKESVREHMWLYIGLCRLHQEHSLDFSVLGNDKG